MLYFGYLLCCGFVCGVLLLCLLRLSSDLASQLYCLLSSNTTAKLDKAKNVLWAEEWGKVFLSGLKVLILGELSSLIFLVTQLSVRNNKSR